MQRSREEPAKEAGKSGYKQLVSQVTRHFGGARKVMAARRQRSKNSLASLQSGEEAQSAALTDGSGTPRGQARQEAGLVFVHPAGLPRSHSQEAAPLPRTLWRPP